MSWIDDDDRNRILSFLDENHDVSVFEKNSNEGTSYFQKYKSGSDCMRIDYKTISDLTGQCRQSNYFDGNEFLMKIMSVICFKYHLKSLESQVEYRDVNSESTLPEFIYVM